MNDNHTSTYYFEQAEFCRRWSRVTDQREAANLLALAEEYEAKAFRLYSIEQAQLRQQALAS